MSLGSLQSQQKNMKGNVFGLQKCTLRRRLDSWLIQANYPHFCNLSKSDHLLNVKTMCCWFLPVSGQNFLSCIVFGSALMMMVIDDTRFTNMFWACWRCENFLYRVSLNSLFVCSSQIECGFFNVPQNYLQTNVVRQGLRLCPYLWTLTNCR